MAESTDVYHPEWLELEKGLGSRPQLAANPDIDIPTFNGLGEHLAAQWPQLEANLSSGPLQSPSTLSEPSQRALATWQARPVAKIELTEPVDETITATATTPPIPVRIYAPSDKGDDLPLVVFFHGGGYISGNIRSEEEHCRIIATRTPAIVVNVDYPLAPQHDLDTIISSGIIAVNWAASHSPPLTKSSALLVAGGSAGGSLAIQLTYAQTQDSALFTRPITGLIALFPFCHPADPPYSGNHSNIHTSYVDKATSAPILTREVMLSFIRPTNPLGLSADPTSPRHFPLLAPTLPNFPRTYVVTAEHDICRDDGRVLALRLKEESTSGVKEDYWEGLPHYFHWFPTLEVARSCMEKVVRGVEWVAGGGA